MTGNKNAWRAPLAGLASLAMIATMGMAAGTANATSSLKPNEGDQYFKVGVYRADKPYAALQSTPIDSYVYGQTFDLDSLTDPYVANDDGKVLTGYSYDLAGKNVVKDAFAVKGDTKLYAQYADAVKVTFKGAGTAGSDAVLEIAKGSGVTEADYAKHITEPTAPAGQVFAGWKLTNNEDAEDLYTGEALNSDTVLYPVFRVYSSEEDQNNASQVFFHVSDRNDKDVTLYTLDGKPFPAYRAPEGTWLDKAGNSYDFATPTDSDANIHYDPSNSPKGADLVLTEVEAASDKNWTVTYKFNADGVKNADATNNGNSKGATVVKHYAADDQAEQPADPAVKNAVFTGWYGVNGADVDFNTPVSQLPGADKSTRTVSIEAGWDTKNVAPVAYYYNYKAQAWQLPVAGEAAGRVTPKTGKALDYVTVGNKLPEPTGLEDYFQTSADKDHGTYTSSKVSAWLSVADNAPISTVNAATSVYAKWDSAEAILLNGNGGSFSNGNNKIYASKTDSQKWQDVVETPMRDGFTFTFWTNPQKTLRANLFDGYYYNNAGDKVAKIVDGNEILANWVENNADQLGAKVYQYGLSFTNKAKDVADLVNKGYTEDSSKAFVDAMYKVEDEYQSYLRLTDPEAKRAAAEKINASIASAEALLVKAGNPVDPPFSSPFADVTVDTPHAQDINKLFEMGITTGWTEQNGTLTFRPTLNMTRQDYAAFLYRLAGSPEFDPAKATKTFADVNATTPHYKAILWAASNGVITGFADNTFRGLASIQRQDALQMLYKLAGSPEVADDAANFTDAAKTPFKAALAWAKATGVSTGYPDGSFGVGLNIIRQDMAAFLVRAAAVLDK